MDSKTRMKNLILKKKIDRVPVNPLASTYTALISNYSARDYYLNPEIAYESHLNSMDLHRYDSGPSYSVPNWQTLDFGGELLFSEEDRRALPTVISYPATNSKEISKLRIPDFKEAPIASRMIKFTEILTKNGFGYGVPSDSALDGAESLVGANLLMRLMIKDPQAVHYLLELNTKYVLDMAKYMLDRFGTEGVSAFSGYPVDSHDLISPKYFEEFSLPYIKEIIETLQDWGVKNFIIHLCGDHYHNLDHWLKSVKLPKRTIFTIGTQMDIVETAERIGSDHIIGGNVRNITLATGHPKDVYNECGEIIKKVKDFEGGFILMPDCGLSSMTPAANVEAMIRAAEDFGSY